MSQHLSGSQSLHSSWGSWYTLGFKDPEDKDHLAQDSTQNTASVNVH